MKRQLMILLVLATLPVHAEWVKFQETPDRGAFYLDLQTVAGSASLRSVWMLADYGERGAQGERSAKILREYDCDSGRTRAVRFEVYKESMGTGALLQRDDEVTPWQPVPPDSPGAAILASVCAAGRGGQSV